MRLSLVSGGVCDPQDLADCTVQTGAQFSISVDAVVTPAGGYILAQAWIEYGDELGNWSANGAVKNSQTLWPDCYPPSDLSANTDQVGLAPLDSYDAGCLTSILPPYPVSNYVGPLFAITLTCPTGGSDHVLNLIPAGTSPAGTSGAGYADSSLAFASAKVSPLNVHCRTDPPPYASALINGTLYESTSGFFRGVTVRLEPLGLEAVTSLQDGSFAFWGMPAGDYKIQPTSCSYVGCYPPTYVTLQDEKIYISIYPKDPDWDTDGDSVPNSVDLDDDNDGCPDSRETGPDPTQGGRRHPHDPYDYYDVLGFNGGPKDGVIDLPNDILGVILHFSPDTSPPYDSHFDRGPTTGANHWKRSGPDGTIDLPNDVLGVILQFNHDCT